MYDTKEFRESVIKPALITINLYSKAAENLLLGTALQESMLTYIYQIGGGPALGFFQMEPETYNDCFDNFLNYRKELLHKLLMLTNESKKPLHNILIYNHRFAAAMCRIKYYRVKEEIPNENNISEMAWYWKKHYNTSKGAGDIDEFIDKYERFGKL